jgi:dTDP-4-amino-4,6-dideoxygalactose transaminase
MSEAQAAIALLSLEDFPDNQKNNERLYKRYENMINDIQGLSLIDPVEVSFSNYQYLVCLVDEEQFGLSRDLLLALLKAENVLARRYFFPGLHRSIPYVNELPQYLDLLPNTDHVCATVLQLPIGAFVSDADVERICNILKRAQNSAREISVRYEK